MNNLKIFILSIAFFGCAHAPISELNEVAKNAACVVLCTEQNCVETDQCVEICMMVSDGIEQVILSQSQKTEEEQEQ